MMPQRPDFSPAMLATFLRARAHLRVAETGEPGRRTATVKAFKAEIRKAAGVTNAEMHFAWMGLLETPETRALLWAVLGFEEAREEIGKGDCHG